MTTFTRESLNKLRDEYKLKEYNDRIISRIDYITDRILSIAKCEDNKEYIIKVKIRGIDDIPPRLNSDEIIVDNTKMVHDINAKLKTIFVDVSIEYVDKTIRINWA